MPYRMSSKERLLAALRREPVDHVPCYGSFNPLSEVQRRGRTWNFPWSPEASEEDRITYQVETLGLDQVVHVGVGATRQAAGVTARTWVEEGLLHKTYATPAGELHAAVRYNDLWPHGQDIPLYSDFNIGHFAEPWIRTHADLACLKQVQVLREVDEILTEARERLKGSFSLARKHRLAVMGNAGMGLTGAQHLFGAADLCMMTLDQPDLVDAYLEHEHRINLRQIAVMGALGVDIIGRNGFYETADFYSPPMLERFLAGRLTAEADAAHGSGTVVAYTAHTGVMPILGHLSRLPVESIRGLDIAFKDADIRAIRDRLAPTKAFWIGPSSTYHIWNGPEATREAVRQVFECFGKRGLILSQCVSSHSIMPWDSTVAMIEEWKRLR